VNLPLSSAGIGPASAGSNPRHLCTGSTDERELEKAAAAKIPCT